MSWVDKINNPFTIATGNGKTFTFAWKNASRQVEFNYVEFEFPNTPGSLVQRSEVKGTRYPIEIYFQGENHLEESERFKVASQDKRAWVIQHPLYGQITAHPISLTFDDTQYNVSKITGTLIETITQDNPKSVVIPADKIKFAHEELKTTFGISFVNDIPEPGTAVKNALTENVLVSYNQVKNQISNTLDAEDYFNKFNEANSAILEATDFPLECITKVQTIINQPFQFEDSVKNRVNMLVSQFNRLRESVENITGRNDKKIYENNAAITVSGIAVSSVTNPDYTNRKEVVAIIDLLSDAYDNYIEDLDGLQSDNGGDPESYIPDAASLRALNDIVNFTLSNLYDIALDSKQERVVILEEDSNVILLAHRFYGLQADDSTIEQIINNNDIGINELLGVRKGRRIIYYV